MPERAGLRWLPEVFDLGFCVTFARGVGPREMLARMGGVPARAVPMTRAEAETEMFTGQDGGPVVRVGWHEGWGYAVESLGVHGSRPEVLRAVSAGTAAVSLLRTAESLLMFKFAENGSMVCSFDVDLPHLRSGKDPDRLLPQMEQLGLAPEVDRGVDTDQAMLALAEAAFGIALPRVQVEAGVLLAARVPSAG